MCFGHVSVHLADRSDRSTNLAKIASQHHPHSAVVADILGLPHAPSSFNFVISIAVVHHLSSTERRIEAVKCLLEPLKPGGRALIYVWALEQESSRRGWTESDDQDVMVPWVTREAKKARTPAPSTTDVTSVHAANGDKTFHRYYHLYRRGELDEDVRSAGGRIVEAGYEKDNWWAIAERAVAE